MHIKKLAVAASTVGAIALSIVAAVPASADYAPSAGDAVIVGSDTLQYAGDFIADGDFLGDAGYNSSGFINKVVNFDASADANARLAYGPQGNGTSCAPGTGTNTGTGNATAPSTGNAVCQLNPTVVLRAGLRPVQRLNGSGAGATALANELLAGVHNIDASRASASQASKFTNVAASVATVTIGTENLAMLGSSTSHMPTGGMSTAELTLLYGANTTTTNPFDATKTGCPSWVDLSTYRVAHGGTAIANASANTIKPLVPQNGSGTRGFFLAASTGINVATPGSCVTTVEENDPTAIAANGGDDAIEPMSQARLYMYQGLNGNGVATGLKYFTDPSCKYTVSGTGCGNPVVANSGAVPVAQDLAPAVTFYSAGTTSATEYTQNRPLYIYIRKSDLGSAVAFQPGIKQNLVRTLFANPCSGTAFDGTNLDTTKTGCVTIGGVAYGPGGQPFFASTSALSLISAAGITAGYTYTPNAV